MEPRVSDTVKGVLYAPSAGIVNPLEYALAMEGTAVRNGVELHIETAVNSIEKNGAGFIVHRSKGDFETRLIVSAAGVYADKVYALLEEPECSIIPTRGQYYLLDESKGLLEIGRASKRSVPDVACVRTSAALPECALTLISATFIFRRAAPSPALSAPHV